MRIQVVQYELGRTHYIKVKQVKHFLPVFSQVTQVTGGTVMTMNSISTRKGMISMLGDN